jgi:hypothetical protein
MVVDFSKNILKHEVYHCSYPHHDLPTTCTSHLLDYNNTPFAKNNTYQDENIKDESTNFHNN